MQPHRSNNSLPIGLAAACFLSLAALASLVAAQPFGEHQRISLLAARRSADDYRPIARVSRSERSNSQHQQHQEPQLVVGRFRAPAPERVQSHRVAKSSELGAQTLSASFRVADQAEPARPDKVVHGITGQSISQRKSQERRVSAKFMVSDEGLNYPPSKLSADIYGNVAEIVTAPPEAVENDFLVPNSNLFGSYANRRD